MPGKLKSRQCAEIKVISTTSILAIQEAEAMNEIYMEYGVSVRKIIL
jgi:hypothetical protein